ncbi:MAG: hypothetical protein WKG07_10125 [Hymenobacter sp.]
MEGVAFATIFDETGRPVNRLATFAVQTQAAMFGIQNLPELVSTRQGAGHQAGGAHAGRAAHHGARRRCAWCGCSGKPCWSARAGATSIIRSSVSKP